jgi:GT2 family glycosyltransferase
VDADALSELALTQFVPGQRVWLEISKSGQIVGVSETVVEADGFISRAKLEELAMRFSAIEISHVAVQDASLPHAAVVVPTLCRDSERLVRTVNTLLELDYPDYEVFVVDNRPTPHEYPIPEFADPTRVTVLEETRRGASSARNRGIKESTGEFVAFTDDDVVVERTWLRELGTRFVTNPEVDGIGGLVLPTELRVQPQLWFEEYFGGFTQSFSTELLSMELMKNDEIFPYGTGRFGAGCNMAFRRSALERNGAFDSLLGIGTPSRGGEDIAIFMKQVLTGGTTAFEPRAVVRHQHRQTEGEFFTQIFGYGTGLTAMYTALVCRDPRHIPKILRRIPAGYRLFTKSPDQRSPSLTSTYPRLTLMRHLLGMAYGPFAYARSVMRSIVER